MKTPETIGDLLARRFRTGADGAQLYASAAVAACNEVLQQHWSATDAVAVSFVRGKLTVNVSHSAIAGHVHHQHDDILQACNRRLEKQFPQLRHPATSIVTRVSL